jgi:hypothetical protein
VESSERWRVITAYLSLADRDSPDARAVRHSPSVEQTLDLFAHLSHGQGGDLFISGEPGERELMVAGGPSLYVVSCIGDRYGAYNLVDPMRCRDGWLTLHAGGVLTEFKESETVEPELVERAIRYFHTHGAIDPQLQWE